MNLLDLATPFQPDEIEWRIGSSGKGQNGQIWAKCLAYVTSRSVMQRLDDVCGAAGWKVEYKEYNAGKDNHGALCGISIKIGDEWVTKWDGANSTDVEPVKGGLSDAMKRAAVQWGIGRYLYKLEAGFVTVTNNRNDNYAKTKDGVAFNWVPPHLPAWALPGKAGGEVEDNSRGGQDVDDNQDAEAPPVKPAQQQQKKEAPAKGSHEEKRLLKIEMDKVADKFKLGEKYVEENQQEVDTWRDYEDAGLGMWVNKLPRRDLQHAAISYFVFLHYGMRIMVTGPFPDQLNTLKAELNADNRLNADQKERLSKKIEDAKEIPW